MLERTTQQQLPELLGVQTRLSNKHILLGGQNEDISAPSHVLMTTSIGNILHSLETAKHSSMRSASLLP